MCFSLCQASTLFHLGMVPASGIEVPIYVLASNGKRNPGLCKCIHIFEFANIDDSTMCNSDSQCLCKRKRKKNPALTGTHR